MYRFFPLFPLALAACTTVTIADRAPRGTLADEGAGGDGGAGTASGCEPDGPYPIASAETPACGSEMACDSDADCAKYPGNYCAPDVCADQGCLRGRCSITKIQGEPCSRDEECYSQICECTAAGPALPCFCAPDLDGQQGPHPH